MNERTRYRVTGSVFLIALAVIFLPMIFDGAGAPQKTIPPLPSQSSVVQPLPNFADVVPASDVVERVETLRQEVDEQGFATDTGTRFGEPVLLPQDDETSIWAVQAASFAKHENAIAFRQQLREAGYEAFISTVRDDDEQMHRVAVGPLLSISDAQDIQSAVAQRYEVEPTIVEMTQ